jgi:hypothetical protein
MEGLKINKETLGDDDGDIEGDGEGTKDGEGAILGEGENKGFEEGDDVVGGVGEGVICGVGLGFCVCMGTGEILVSPMEEEISKNEAERAIAVRRTATSSKINRNPLASIHMKMQRQIKRFL